MFEIRRATPDDAEKILEYCKIIGGQSDNLTYGPEGIPFTVEKEKEFLENMMCSDRQLFLVAVNDGEIVGTATFKSLSRARLAHRATIGLAVKKSMWGNHIGTHLMEKLMDFAANTAKVQIISLEVRSDNKRAISLYKKFGFEKVGTFPGFMKIDGKDIDCDIMCVQLYN